MLKLKVDRIDAIGLAMGTLNTVPELKKNWKPIFNFQKQASGAMLVSPLVSEELKKKITSILLDNGPVITQVWQVGAGMGPFVAPDELPIENLGKH